MPEKTRRLSWRCDLCDRPRVPTKPLVFARPAFGAWAEARHELHLCNACYIELADAGRAAFPGDDHEANRLVSRLRLLTRRPWKWHREPTHPRLFFVEETALNANGGHT